MNCFGRFGLSHNNSQMFHRSSHVIGTEVDATLLVVYSHGELSTGQQPRITARNIEESRPKRDKGSDRWPSVAWRRVRQSTISSG